MRLADGLLWTREQVRVLKPIVDLVRSIIAPRLLLSTAGNKIRQGASAAIRLARLMAWLQATGEFKRELARLEIWRTYILQLDSREQSRVSGSSANCTTSSSGLRYKP